MFQRRLGHSDHPLDLSEQLELPCGKCNGCRLAKAKEWAIRCVHEAKMHEANSFVTLTYDERNLPKDGSLDLSHWQKFAKRLRQAIGPFRFLHCGEYGERTQRPHYHACLFGLDFYADRYYWRSIRGNPYYRSPLLERVWGKGHCEIGALTFQSAAYVARYCMKKQVPAQDDARYERFDPGTGELWRVRPEYCTMSRRPGLGSSWLEQYMTDVYPHDQVVHNGSRFRPPRYYDGKLPEADLEKLKAKRKLALSKQSSDRTEARLRTRENCMAARLSWFERETA